MTTPTHQLPENSSYEMDFDQPAINIGSHSDNDIVLLGTGVSPFHVSLILQAGECQILPLDPNADVRLDGKVVQSAQFKLSGAARQLNIGENILFLQHNKTFDSLHVRINPAKAVSNNEIKPKDAAQLASPTSALPVAESAILLNLLSQAGEVEVGQTASYELDVVNAGPLVASFNIFIEGVPKEWVSISPEEINLNEGQHKRVHINIIPPRQPSSTAGQHELRVSAFSANYPDHQAAVSIMLSIKPYYEFTVGNLSPREQSMRWPKKLADTSLPITNLGNCPADFAVSALDDENGCSFDFVMDDGLRLSRQATLSDVSAGEMLSLPIEVSPHKRPFFALSNKRYSYTTTVQVTNHPIAPQQVSGFLTSRPLVGRWSVILTVLLILIVAFFVVQPNIYDFQVAAKKDIIELGDSTKLLWSVSPFASRVTISNTDQLLNSGQTSITITPKQSTTYELVSGNWLSGLLNMDRRESRTVLVVPPSPTINVFAVDNMRVAEGKPVHIRWSVTQADQAFLTIDNVVTELPKEKFSGEQDVVLAKDSLVTLDAKNTGGDALRSYFVNVEKPNINVVTFTVWVATEKTGLPSKNRAAKLDAPLQASPDPNFPEKYVELIPDKASDNGYRANFYQPDRQLAKGEQVLVEWNVNGVDNDKVKIAPFTDELPSKGSQAYFPKESMNFVLTAKSGALEKIFMLPVKVFDGTPPTAPKIEFFQGVPVSMVGPGDVQFSWSVTGAWTRIQLMTGDKIIADYLNPAGAKTIRVSQSATYILVAWNGTLSSAKPLDITINPELIPVDLKIDKVSPDSDQFLVGNKIIVSITIKGIGPNANGKPFPTGTITVTDGVSTCSISLSALSCELTFKTAGDKKIWANYSGDTLYSQGRSLDYPAGKKTIHVTSPTVKLTPNFYLQVDKDGNAIGDPMADVTSHKFRMDEKLYAVIDVAPISGAILPVDTKGHVTLTMCKQDSAGEATDDCGDPIAATVKVETDGSFGTAKIEIKNFPGSGTYALRFDYRHDDNLLAPATYTQYDVHVLPMSIYLTLPPATACIDSIPENAICSFSYTDPEKAHIVFDIHQAVGKNYLDNSMPDPKLNKTSILKVYETGSKSDPLKCTMDTRKQVDAFGSRSVYILDCVVNVVGKATLFINYEYSDGSSNDYSMEDSPKLFSLQPAIQTDILFAKSDYYVGQIISLTPKQDLLLVELDTKKTILKSTGKLTFSSTDADNEGLFGVTPDSTCSASANGNAILDIDVDEPCKIFFRRIGPWNVKIVFSGDNNYAGSSASVSSINVTQKALVTTKWYYSDDSTINPNKAWDSIAKTSEVSITGKVVFTGVFSGLPNKLFSDKVFDGVQLLISRESSDPSCTFSPLTNPTITYQPSTQQAAFNFVVTCPKIPAKVKLNLLGFASPDDFGLLDVNRDALFADSNNLGGVYFELAPVQGGYFNFDWHSANPPPSPKEIPLLFAGEPYQIHVMYQPVLILRPLGCNDPCLPLLQSLEVIQYEDAPSVRYRKIHIKLPASWNGKVASLSGTNCSLDIASNSIVVPLIGERQQPDDSHVELSFPKMLSNYVFDDTNPCTVVFGFSGEPKSNLPLGVGASTKFSFQSINGTPQPNSTFTEPTIGIVYSAEDSYTVKGLTKAFVTAKFDTQFKTKVKVGSTAQTVIMTLTNPDTVRPPLTTNTLADWFDLSYPSCMKINGTVDSATQVTWTLTPPETEYPCTGTLAIYYKENTYFGRALLVSQDVQFAP